MIVCIWPSTPMFMLQGWRSVWQFYNQGVARKSHH